MMVVDDDEDLKIISQYFGCIVDYSYIADISGSDNVAVKRLVKERSGFANPSSTACSTMFLFYPKILEFSTG